MPHGGLIESVQHQAAIAIGAVWAEARAEAARCQADADQSIDQQRERYASQLLAVAAAAAQAANAAAAKRARTIRSDAKAAVAERARRIAGEALGQLRDASYAGRFAALVRELPPRDWTRIVVNERDESLARSHFAGCDVALDSGLIGGVIAEDRALRVNNTFEQRLTAAWPDLLPAVMTDVLDLLRRAQSAA